MLGAADVGLDAFSDDDDDPEEGGGPGRSAPARRPPRRRSDSDSDSDSDGVAAGSRGPSGAAWTGRPPPSALSLVLGTALTGLSVVPRRVYEDDSDGTHSSSSSAATSSPSSSSSRSSSPRHRASDPRQAAPPHSASSHGSSADLPAVGAADSFRARQQPNRQRSPRTPSRSELQTNERRLSCEGSKVLQGADSTPWSALPLTLGDALALQRSAAATTSGPAPGPGPANRPSDGGPSDSLRSLPTAPRLAQHRPALPVLAAVTQAVTACPSPRGTVPVPSPRDSRRSDLDRPPPPLPVLSPHRVPTDPSLSPLSPTSTDGTALSPATAMSPIASLSPSPPLKDTSTSEPEPEPWPVAVLQSQPPPVTPTLSPRPEHSGLMSVPTLPVVPDRLLIRPKASPLGSAPGSPTSPRGPFPAGPAIPQPPPSSNVAPPTP
eukprot:EG_transcript_13246